MEKLNKTLKNSEKAITLISLVVTIIVLLILAGISISMLSGDNSILSKAGQARDITGEKSIAERVQLIYLGALAEGKGEATEEGLTTSLNSEFGYGNYTLAQDLSKVTIDGKDYRFDGTVTGGGSFDESEDYDLGPNGKKLVNKDNIPNTSHEEIIGEDEYGNQVVVPNGFKVADDSGTNVKTGIVIEDSEGNQYVWVPVSNINHDGSNKIKVNSTDEEGVEITLGRYTFDTSTGVPPLTQGTYQYASTFETPVVLGSTPTSSKYYKELTTYRESNGLQNSNGTNTTAKEIGVFIDSVRTNKGYYIARYEASYRTNGKAASIQSTSSDSRLALRSAPDTREEGELWNFITQGEAATACQNLYTTVKSDLMNSYAWDTSILYIQTMGNTNYANADRGSNTSLLNTGTTGDQKCKIYDMAGNEYEWTTEYSTDVLYSNAFPCVYRGGVFNKSLSYTTYFTGARAGKGAHAGSYLDSFRPVLYIK